MKIVCSFCKCSLGDCAPLESSMVTSTICPSCYEIHSKRWLNSTVQRYLVGITDPACIFSNDCRILAFNEPFKHIFINNNSDVRGLLCGEVICCHFPKVGVGQRCGDTEHCKTCKVRAAIECVFQTGQDQHKIDVAVEQDQANKEMVVSVLRKVEGVVFIVHQIKDQTSQNSP